MEKAPSDPVSLTFQKSYNKGHCMDVVRDGLMSGADLVEAYSGRTKNKVFFFVRSTTESCTTTGHGLPSTHPNPDRVDLTSPPKDGKSTRAYLARMAGDQNDMDCIITYQGSSDHVKDNEDDVKTDELVVEHANVLTGEPTIVGNVTEDLAFPGLFATGKGKERGRLGEVVAVIHDLSEIVKRLPPFLPITLEEMMKQGKEENAVCLLVLVAHKSLNNQQSYVSFLFDALDRRCKLGAGTFLFWVAESHSKEGMKVQSKYGVAVGQTTLLIMVPSHIPQCVEIFNESNLDERKLGKALAQAVVQCQDLKEKSETVKNRRALVKEQDEEFSKQIAEQKLKEKKEEEEVEVEEGKVEAAENAEQNEENAAEDSEDEESEVEVQFGPCTRVQGVKLEDTLEDPKDETNPKKKNKKKKKKKKNKKRKNKDGDKVDEPTQKKVCPGD